MSARTLDARDRKNAARRKAPVSVRCSVCDTSMSTAYVRPRNYCSRSCYAKGQLIRASERAKNSDIPRCFIPGCARAGFSRGLCSAHYQRRKTKTRMDTPIQKKTKGGGEWANGYGYIISNTPSGHMMKHRWVMQQHIGRPLLRQETVHHINGDRTDNRIENLELWSDSHPAGQRVADKLAWAREFIAQYEGRD